MQYKNYCSKKYYYRHKINSCNRILIKNKKNNAVVLNNFSDMCSWPYCAEACHIFIGHADKI